MYRQEIGLDFAHARGWDVHLYDAKTVVDEAARLLGERADEILQGPRSRLGPPWNRRTTGPRLAATFVA